MHIVSKWFTEDTNGKSIVVLCPSEARDKTNPNSKLGLPYWLPLILLSAAWITNT